MTNLNIAEFITYTIRYTLITCNFTVIRFMYML